MQTKINNFFGRLEGICLSFLLFLFPSQLAFHFWPEYSFVFGMRVDYLSPAIYLTDILSFILIIFWVFLRKVNFVRTVRANKKIFYIFFAVAAFNVLYSTFLSISLFRWLKFFLFLLLAFYFHGKKDNLIKPLYLSGVFFSLVGILQFALGRTLGSAMYFLGERSFTTSTPGIALFSIFGREFLRAYSTFSHPNSMAGYLSVLSIYLMLSGNFKKLSFKVLGFGIIFLGILLTFSVSSLISLLICAGFYLLIKRCYSKIIFVYLLGLVVFLISVFQIKAGDQTPVYKYFRSERIAQRLEFASSAGEMISKNAVIGVGLNTFVPNLPKYQAKGGLVWLLQPVHNIFLLTFSEVGFVGLFILASIFYAGFRLAINSKKYYLIIPIIFVIFSGLADHYWLTIQQNNLLLIFLFSHFI